MIVLDWLMTILQDMGHTLRLPISFVVIEFIGTLAFAISGVRLASAKQFDIFGAWIVGMATAIGGGTIRDLMLGVNPFWMTNISYFACCALAVLWVIVFGKQLVRQKNTWFIFDTIGLALFNVIGIEKTLNMGFPYWTAITMGSITGAAGGVIRDVFINEIPLIFRKEICAGLCVGRHRVQPVPLAGNDHRSECPAEHHHRHCNACARREVPLAPAGGER